ncbi:MAG: trimethylamine corrinoid protein 2 [Oscillospiraceae bacterium]|nr:trimethylamine corrinoid protein 2 [Oscillospiraceae bacterium]
MIYKYDSDAVKQRFDAWWHNDLSESPLLWLTTSKEPSSPPRPSKNPETDEEIYTDAENISARFYNHFRGEQCLGDAFPHLGLNLGPGSVALYLGSQPIFRPDTLWYLECVGDWDSFELKYDESNKWWILHQDMIKRALELSGGEYYIDIPDLIENLDILSAMRGPQNTCYDLMDCPDLLKKRLDELDALYFKYYDRIFEMVKDSAGDNSYTAFNIIGKGKTAKVQCDFSAMMSPAQFVDFVVPSLKKQCGALDNSLYHLDGKDAIIHLPALMSIENLSALQWTPGAGQPDCADEKWYPVYDAAHEAGKAKWVSLYGGDLDARLCAAKKFVARYGIKGTYFLFGHMNQEDAAKLMKSAAKGFK